MDSVREYNNATLLTLVSENEICIVHSDSVFSHVMSRELREHTDKLCPDFRNLVFLFNSTGVVPTFTNITLPCCEYFDSKRKVKQLGTIPDL